MLEIRMDRGKIEIVEIIEKALVKTNTMFLMEHALECANGKRT